MSRSFVVATRNAHKLSELGQILPGGVVLAPLPDDLELPPEDAETFTGNALIKARAAHQATGLPAIADDSGICAAALGGRPGVRSARYAGAAAGDGDNLAKLIEELSGAEDTTLEYVCVIALVDASGERTFEGRCAGDFSLPARGDGGFGYDPVFLPRDTGPGDERTMAELDPGEKHAISHRGRAARSLAAALSLGPAGEAGEVRPEVPS